VLHEINKNQKKGVRIDIEKEPRKYKDRLFELINIHYLKHNGEPFYLNNEFINKTQEYMGHDCKFYISWKNGKITGTSFSIAANGIQNNYIAAVDRKLAEDDLTFFNIAFHKPLMDAISNGIKRVDHGLGMAEMKIRRGCKTGNQFLCYKASNNIFNLTVKPWFLFLSMWYQRKNAKISNRFD
jgi:predicted N-acyltransferase